LIFSDHDLSTVLNVCGAVGWLQQSSPDPPIDMNYLIVIISSSSKKLKKLTLDFKIRGFVRPTSFRWMDKI
jgi:hypothetical protein